MPAAVGVVMRFFGRLGRAVSVVMPAAVGVVMRFFGRLGRAVSVVMPAAVAVVMRFFGRLGRAVGVVMPAAVAVVMGFSRPTGSTFKRHFVKFFTIQLHPGMVTTGSIHQVIPAAVFSAVGGVVMRLLRRHNRSKAQ